MPDAGEETIRWVLKGMPDLADLDHQEVYQVRVASIVEGFGGAVVSMHFVPADDPMGDARRRIGRLVKDTGVPGRPAALAVASASLAVADQLRRAVDKLDSIDDALRNTIGGVPY